MSPRRLAIAILLPIVLSAACTGDVSMVDSGNGEDLPDVGETFDSECFRCHGNSLSPAPPRAVGGGSDTSYVGVGAHRSHLGDDSTWHTPVACSSCHVVPEATNDQGHIDDGDNIAEVIFSGLAIAGNMKPVWDRETATCDGVYCHGAAMTSGLLAAPLWTTVNGSQKECGTCHGNPPPEPHTQSTDCGSCHPTMIPGTDRFRDPSSHIDGKVDVGDGASCDSCHGSDGISAPPRDLAGSTDRASQGVGAHREHLALSTWRREIACSNCHVSPVDVGDPGHLDGDNVAEVPFDALNPTATFDHAGGTCNNLYCHGNGRGSNGSVAWTSTADMGCGSCHASTTSGLGGQHKDHHSRYSCDTCHAEVASNNTTIINANLHVDGKRQVKMKQGTYDPATKRCSNSGCHGTERWGGG